jgi:hypothetical protein
VHGASVEVARATLSQLRAHGEADTASALFALERRVRPFNKYLEQELRDRPIAGGAITIDDVIALLEGDASRQRTIFRTVEQRAKEEGFGEVIAGWEPDVAWLRGEAGYREAASGGGGVARG